jgi:glycerophosphoryl diester phosphodiesterase
MDVVITKDQQIIVSHEPTMLPLIMAYPDGSRDDAMNDNIYNMTAKEAQTFLCGIFPHPRFPEQLQIKSYKPLLKETVDSVRQFCVTQQLKEPLYNIELKTIYEQNTIGQCIIGDDKFHPNPENYVQLFLKTIEQLDMLDKLVIQSFDPRILEAMHKQSPSLPLVYLSEDTLKSAEVKLSELSFTPNGYSVYYPMIDQSLIDYCARQHIQLLAWTVNDPGEIERLVKMGVKEIITDYPDRALVVREKLSKH